MTQSENNSKFEEIYLKQTKNKPFVGNTNYSERRTKLEKLHKIILENKDAILFALKADLNKSFTEGQLTELYPVVTDLKHTMRHLKKWMKKKRVSTPITLFGARSYIQHEAKGLTLIMSPWNYPFQLALSPLVYAIAGGNCAIIKPSEKSPNTSRIVRLIIEKTFEEREVAVIEGNHIIAQNVLKYSFDHIFFTGGTTVGKLVMKVAAEHLCSITLELGGKSPVVVDGTYNLEIAAKRIVWGKFMNAGQTCIAPDYVLVKKDKSRSLIDSLIKHTKALYAEDGSFATSKSYARIIDDDHFVRLVDLLNQAKESGSTIESGGNFDRSEKYIEPTILSGVSASNPIMKEEIFGPVLPVIVYDSEEEAIEAINSNSNPLSLYVFSSNKKFVNRLLSNCPSGGVTINDVLLQFVNTNLPFGGVKSSGIGKSHGYAGFCEFTNQRAIVEQSRFTPVSLLYPPYTEMKQKLADILLKYF